MFRKPEQKKKYFVEPDAVIIILMLPGYHQTHQLLDILVYVIASIIADFRALHQPFAVSGQHPVEYEHTTNITSIPFRSLINVARARHRMWLPSKGIYHLAIQCMLAK